MLESMISSSTGLPWQQMLSAVLFAIALRLLLGSRLSLPLAGRPAGGVASQPEPPPAESVSDEIGLVDEQQAPGQPCAPAGVDLPPAEPEGAIVSPLNLDDLLGRGEEAARAGDRAAGHELFRRAVAIEPASEQAWLWLAGTSGELEEAASHLERVVEINPNNARARRGLDVLRAHLAPRS